MQVNTPSIPSGTFHAPQDEIEKRKDRLDLRPALEFVTRHISKYESGFHRFMLRPRVAARAVEFSVLQNKSSFAEAGTQVLPVQARDIVARMPTPILQLSMLERIDYSSATIVPIPIYDDQGFWHGAVESVELSKFPRPTDHPGRILIGRSTGKVIYTSALPVSISTNERARWFYQLHVFTHELFHTVELLRRNKGVRQKILLHNGRTEFTLDQWWSKWEDEFLPTMKPPFATRYAANYGDDLSWDIQEKNPDVSTRALAEQICESFVGYIIGIAPNDDDNPDFRTHSPMAWDLINDLAMAKLVKW